MIHFSQHLDAPCKMLFPNPEISTKVKGMVFCTHTNGTLVDITVKSSAYLLVYEASTHKIKHVEEVGIDISLRVVTSQDGMTSNWYNFEHEFLDDVARKGLTSSQETWED